MNEDQNPVDEAWNEPQDRALYQVLGMAEDIEPGHDFQAKVLEAVREKKAPARVFPWRPWTLVAAAFLVAVTVFMLDQEKGSLPPVANGSADMAEANEVYESMNELSELDLLALEVEELGSIHDDWFGG